MTTPQTPENQQTSTSPAKGKISKQSVLIGAIAILLIGVGTAAGYFFGKSQRNVTIPVSPSKEPPTPSPFVLPIIDSWQEYASPSAPFSFEYPAEWTVKNNGSGGVLVSSYPDSCSQCSEEEKQNYYAFYVQNDKDYRKFKVTLVAPKQSYRSGAPHKLDENHPLIYIVDSLKFE